MTKYATEAERKAAKYRQRKEWQIRNGHRPEIRARENAQVKASRKRIIEAMSTEELENYKKTLREKQKLSRRTNPKRHMLNDARKRAKQKGLEFSLTIDDIPIPLVCPVLGIYLKQGDGARTSHSPSLDRIDNLKGYTLDNTCVISYRANALKNDATITEIRCVLQYMEDNYVLVR